MGRKPIPAAPRRPARGPVPLHFLRRSLMSTPATATAAPETAPETAAPSGREKNGRFAKGNPGGPGNPYARKVAAIRKQMLEFMTPERTVQYMAILWDFTVKGHAWAAKLLGEYTAGK